MASKSGYALKHATGPQKFRYMNEYVELRETIRTSENVKPTCPKCGEVITSRPLYLVGMTDLCFGCYEANKRAEAAEAIRTMSAITEEAQDDYFAVVISSGEVIEHSPVIVRENAEIPF
jgi:hypothetical protein